MDDDRGCRGKGYSVLERKCDWEEDRRVRFIKFLAESAVLNDCARVVWHSCVIKRYRCRHRKEFGEKHILVVHNGSEEPVEEQERRNRVDLCPPLFKKKITVSTLEE